MFRISCLQKLGRRLRWLKRGSKPRTGHANFDPFDRAGLCMLVVLSLAAIPGPTSATEASPFPDGATDCWPVNPEAKGVKITTRREGGVTRFYVENSEFCDITLTFQVGLLNLRSGARFPYTASFPPRQSSEAFALSPIKDGARWSYNYTTCYKLGRSGARHDDTCVYELPYLGGQSFEVTQSHNGKFSHKGSTKFAVDWEMPEGTPIRAARGGVVVRVRDDSSSGGASMKYDDCSNYVLIQHDDGTLGHYCHLRKGGCPIALGQTVEAGDLIAHSGNTGFSSGPHLHFCVLTMGDDCKWGSVPVKFRTTEANSATLLRGHRYEAPARPAEARSRHAPARQASNPGRSRT